MSCSVRRVEVGKHRVRQKLGTTLKVRERRLALTQMVETKGGSVQIICRIRHVQVDRHPQTGG